MLIGKEFYVQSGGFKNVFFFGFLRIYNLHAYAFAILGLPYTQAFRQYPAGSRQNRYRHSRCVILTRHNLQPSREGRGRVHKVMTTSRVHHYTLDHRQLSVCTYNIHEVWVYICSDILPLGELVTDRLWLALKKQAMECRPM